MLSTEIAFLIAVAICLAVSGILSLTLHGPLRRLLTDMCGTEDRAKFWTMYVHILLFITPLITLIFGRNTGPFSPSIVFEIVDQIKWALLGLLGILFMIALGVACFMGSRDSLASRGEVDDLQRLLAKVDEIRAREMARHSPMTTEKIA
jgi:hypothetical protein